MDCQAIMKSKCPLGHCKSWKCHRGDPASCRTCDTEKRLKDRQQEEEFERQRRRDLEEQEHKEKMAAIDHEIQKLRMNNADARKTEDMARALEQRRQDLEEARRQSTSMPSINSHQKLSGLQKAIQTVVPAFGKSEKAAEPRGNASEQKKSGDNPTSSTSETEWKRQKAIEGSANDAIDGLMKMTGLEDVKAQVLRIKAKVETAQRQNTDVADERFGVVLLGNPGTGESGSPCSESTTINLYCPGKTTVARLYAKFLASLGVLNGTEFFEASGSSLANDGVAGVKKHVEKIIEAGGGAFFLDEAYQLTEGHNYGGAAVLDYLLAEIENKVGQIVFIFAGYTKQMEKFFEHNPGLNDRIPYRLHFTDYSDPELSLMFERRVHDKYRGRMRLEGGFDGLYARIAIRRLGRSRGREGFGNARALMNLIAKIGEHQAARIQEDRRTTKKPDDFLFTKEDLIGPDPSEAILRSPAWAELQSLIGLKAVKASVQSLIHRISINYKRELEEKEIINVSLNRVFIGSPGTGKTSVGKLYGQILADVGLLSIGEGKLYKLIHDI